MNAEPIARKIFTHLIDTLFDVPIMGNLYRPHYVERLVAIGLGEGFKLVSADWAGWDIEHKSGMRIEVKQSAALQTWTNEPSGPKKPAAGSFDIAPRNGYWTNRGSRWVPAPGRLADIYIFAWHPIVAQATADHRDPTQWVFFVVPSGELPPNQKTISRKVVGKRWPAIGFHELREVILNAANDLLENRKAGRW